MQLGFVTAILSELTIENVLGIARREGFATVGVRCWQALPNEKGYTSGTHVDVSSFTRLKAESLLNRCKVQNVCISSLETYPIILGADHVKSWIAIKRFRKTITAASRLGLRYVSVFVVRDQTQSIDENWSEFLRVCRPLVKYAKQRDIDVCLKTSPAFFNHEHRPVGENLLASPFLWCRVFSDIPALNLGLECDPLSLLSNGIAPLPILREYGSRIFTVHVTTATADYPGPTERGPFNFPSHVNSPAPLHWRDFSNALLDIGYNGPVCLHLDGREMELPMAQRIEALRKARAMMAPYASTPQPQHPAHQPAIRVA